MELALALHDSGHIGGIAFNPKVAHNYAKVLSTRTKDDLINAGGRVAAHYAQHMLVLALATFQPGRFTSVRLRTTLAMLRKQSTKSTALPVGQ